MADSAVPAVIDALTASFAAIPNVEVQDGPKPKAVGYDVIAVGVGNPAVSDRIEHAAGLALRYNETFSINCALWSWTGDKNSKPHRDRCLQLIAAIRATLEPDKTLGGVCQWAQLGGRFDWLQSWVGEGAACQVNFSIDVKATI